MTPHATRLLQTYRAEARATLRQPDELLAEALAAVLEDVARPLEGVSPGYLRRAPRHEVRPAKQQRPAIDQKPEEIAALAQPTRSIDAEGAGGGE